MKKARLLLLLGAFLLSGCGLSGIRAGSADLYGAQSFVPEQLVQLMDDEYNVWLCSNQSRQTALFFLPKDSPWRVSFPQGGWHKVEEASEVSDAVLLMRQYYIIGRYTQGVGYVSPQGDRDFVGYLFAPVMPTMHYAKANSRSLVVDKLTWRQVLRAGKVPGTPYPDRL